MTNELFLRITGNHEAVDSKMKDRVIDILMGELSINVDIIDIPDPMDYMILE